MTALFFSLIRLSIGVVNNLSHDPSTDEWEKLYRISKMQSLIGVCFVGMKRYMETAQRRGEKTNIPQKLYYQWLGNCVQITQRNELINQRCVELHSRLSLLGFNSSILKGQVVATLYGELKYFRQPGDIDVYVDCGREKVIDYARSIGQESINWDYKHLHLKVFDDVEVEMHYRPDVSCNPFRNPRLQKFWIQHKNDFFSGHVDLGFGLITCPHDTMHIFFLIHHIYRHVIAGGVGLRQIMDLYYALKNRDVLEDNRLRKWTETYGLTKISQTLMWILVTVFGVDEDTLPWSINEKEGQFLLQEIMIGGNFGKADKRYGNANNRFAIFIKVIKRNMHLLLHYGSDALFAPLYYIWHFCWKRLVKKY